MSSVALQKIAGIKASLSKKLALGIDSLSDEDVELSKDMFEQLDKIDVTLDVLTKTLIGTVVSKFKTHDELGPPSRALVKKWKKAAKEEGNNGTSAAAAGSSVAAASSSSSSSAAAAAASTHSNKTPPPSSSSLSKSSSSTTKAAGRSRKQERRESTMSVSDDVQALQDEWASLQPHRQTTCQKLHEIMRLAKPSLMKEGINGNAIDQLVVERATEIEGSIQKLYFREKSEYLSKARSLCFNIKKNIGLASQIILGQISGEDLVTMGTDQLVTAEKRKEMEDKAKKLVESRQLDWDAQNESKINEMCGIKGELLQASLFTW
jgi:transcription elongation factor S-II